MSDGVILSGVCLIECDAADGWFMGDFAVDGFSTYDSAFRFSSAWFDWLQGSVLASRLDNLMQISICRHPECFGFIATFANLATSKNRDVARTEVDFAMHLLFERFNAELKGSGLTPQPLAV